MDEFAFVALRTSRRPGRSVRARAVCLTPALIAAQATMAANSAIATRAANGRVACAAAIQRRAAQLALASWGCDMGRCIALQFRVSHLLMDVGPVAL